jgi:hypothetical protein
MIFDNNHSHNLLLSLHFNNETIPNLTNNDYYYEQLIQNRVMI